MPPIKKIRHDVIAAHQAHHAEHRYRSGGDDDDGRSTSGTSSRARLKALLLGTQDGGKRVRALDTDDRQTRRQAILDAAERLFGERQSLVNVADVAESAGLAKGTVYLYFQTKEEIYLALHARHVEHFFTTLIARLNVGEPFLFDEMHALATEHLLNAPTYMPLGACCIGFAANAVPLAATMQFQAQMTEWLGNAGAGLERHFSKLAPGEGGRLLTHSYAIMIGMFSLMRSDPGADPTCPHVPGMGTWQQEASLALTRYWAHVTGIADTAGTTPLSMHRKE